MLLYLDTSALLPLLVSEPGSAACLAAWHSADVVTSSRLLIVETLAALAQAERMQRISPEEFRSLRSEAESLLAYVSMIEVGSEVINDAGTLAVSHGLRGYDAVHLASSQLVKGDDVVAATGDRRLLQAWNAIGFVTIDTARPHSLSTKPTCS